MLICGIDPGKSGAVAIIDTGSVASCRVMRVAVTPTIKVGKTKRDYDCVAMAELLSGEPKIDFCLIERQQAFRGQGVSSMFSLGVGYGMWLGILGALRIPHETVSPRVWTKAMVGGGRDGKASNILACRRLFPEQTLLATDRSRKEHDGLADALLIAEYASRIGRFER